MRTLELCTAARPPGTAGRQRGGYLSPSRNAQRTWCDVAALGITDDRFISILSSKTSVYVIRNMRSWFGLQYLSECGCLFSSRYSPRELTRDLGIQFVDADWSLAKDAGHFKSKK